MRGSGLLVGTNICAKTVKIQDINAHWSSVCRTAGRKMQNDSQEQENFLNNSRQTQTKTKHKVIPIPRVQKTSCLFSSMSMSHLCLMMGGWTLFKRHSHRDAFELFWCTTKPGSKHVTLALSHLLYEGGCWRIQLQLSLRGCSRGRELSSWRRAVHAPFNRTTHGGFFCLFF